ncbi:MAG: DUF1214 domain-containing protein [Pseudomonadota bacterium]
MRTIIFYIFLATCGIALGGVSAWYSIRHVHGFAAIDIGVWTAYPFAAADEIDPYTVARSVAEGTVPLGVSEGLAFETQTDDNGNVLSTDCDYDLEGTTPPSRLWTLVAYDEQGYPLKAAPGGSSSKYSGSVIRYPDGSFLISISARPKPGNWLSLVSGQTFRLVLRLYDTSITSNTDLLVPEMPAIRRLECRS